MTNKPKLIFPPNSIFPFACISSDKLGDLHRSSLDAWMEVSAATAGKKCTIDCSSHDDIFLYSRAQVFFWYNVFLHSRFHPSHIAVVTRELKQEMVY